MCEGVGWWGWEGGRLWHRSEKSLCRFLVFVAAWTAIKESRKADIQSKKNRNSIKQHDARHGHTSSHSNNRER